jgi:hypothetical protein
MEKRILELSEGLSYREPRNGWTEMVERPGPSAWGPPPDASSSGRLFRFCAIML